ASCSSSLSPGRSPNQAFEAAARDSPFESNPKTSVCPDAPSPVGGYVKTAPLPFGSMRMEPHARSTAGGAGHACPARNRTSERSLAVGSFHGSVPQIVPSSWRKAPVTPGSSAAARAQFPAWSWLYIVVPSWDSRHMSRVPFGLRRFGAQSISESRRGGDEPKSHSERAPAASSKAHRGARGAQTSTSTPLAFPRPAAPESEAIAGGVDAGRGPSSAGDGHQSGAVVRAPDPTRARDAAASGVRANDGQRRLAGEQLERGRGRRRRRVELPDPSRVVAPRDHAATVDERRAGVDVGE